MIEVLIKKIKFTENYDEWIEFIADRPFNDQRYYISNQKLKNLGWSIQVQFNDGGAFGADADFTFNKTSNTLTIGGPLIATSKSFDIKHPTKKGKRLRYGSLEGPENGVYVRGRANSTKINLPDYWTGLVDEESITVNLTPIGKHQKLYVEDISNNTVTIGNDNLIKKEINCFYTVYAERKDINKITVEYKR